MSNSIFYRECSCSLLSVRPHPVTTRTDWARHLAVQEQDRLDRLFARSSSDDNIFADRLSSDDLEETTFFEETSSDGMGSLPGSESLSEAIDSGMMSVEHTSGGVSLKYVGCISLGT